MAEFRLVADARFEADDIDDALTILAAHFLAITLGTKSPLDFVGPSSVQVGACSTTEVNSNNELQDLR